MRAPPSLAVTWAALATACVAATANPGAPDEDGADRVVLKDGSAWSGQVLGVRDGAYLLQTPGGEERLAPLESVAEVRFGSPRPERSATQGDSPVHLGVDLSTAGAALRVIWNLDHGVVDTAGVRAGLLAGLVLDSSASVYPNVGGQASFFVDFAPHKSWHLEALAGPGVIRFDGDAYPLWHAGFAFLIGPTTGGVAVRLGLTGGLLLPASDYYLLFAPDAGITATW